MPKAEVLISIDAILQEYAAWADEIVESVADELLREAKNNAATAFVSRSGKLRKSIKKKKSQFNEGSVLVGATAPQAHLVEHGHNVTVKDGRVVGHAAAHPFLGPAAEAVKERLPQIVSRVVTPTVVVGK